MPDEDRIFLGHTTGVVVGSITRPNNTTPYATGDVIGTAALSEIALVAAARSEGGAGMLVGLHVIDSASQATKPDIEVWLFKAALAAAVADNAAFAPSDADLANLVGVVHLNQSFVGAAGSGAAGNCILGSSPPPSLGFRCATGSDDLVAVLVLRNTYTPVVDEVFTVVAVFLQDY